MARTPVAGTQNPQQLQQPCARVHSIHLRHPDVPDVLNGRITTQVHTVDAPPRKQQVVHRPAQHKEPDGHSIDLLWNDFTEAIAHKKRPTCDIEVGHLSTNLSLLGMASYKLGRGITWDGKTERCVQDEEANQLLKRTYRGDWTYPDA